MEISRRVLAARKNARLGGLKTASTHSAEFLEERASKAGNATRDTYGNEFYGYIARQRKPSRVAQKEVIKEITNSVKEPSTTTELMSAAVKTLNTIQM
jgi:hypothetical protein